MSDPSVNRASPPTVNRADAGRLTAGEWRDLDHWDFWIGLRRRQSGLRPDVALARFGLAVDDQIAVTLRGANGPAVDVPVRLFDRRQRLVAEARSDAHGRATLAFAAAGRALRVEAGGVGRAVAPGDAITLQLQDAAPARNLDVMVVVDVTGSMCDELSWLQRELGDVLERATAVAGQLTLRTAVSAYRDEGDEFVVRPSPFRADPADAIDDLNRVRCGGGGDTPEAVDQALADAIHDHEWSENAVGRVLFLVLDAPPHADQATQDRLQRSIAAAQRKGVRIIAVAGSGIDKAAEYFLRGVAALTGGTYVFLTDHSGIGGAHIKPTVGPHAIESLNDLLVRLIRDAAGESTTTPVHASSF